MRKIPSLVSNVVYDVTPTTTSNSLPKTWDPIVPARTPLSISTAIPQPSVGPYVHWLAPNFALNTLEGQAVELSDYRGQVVLLNFWTSWCVPCKEEMPAIQTVYETYQDRGFVVLGINITALDEQVEVEQFVDEMNLTFPILLDTDGKVSDKLYRVRSIPTSFFINKDGKVYSVYFGPMSKEKIDQTLRELLEK